MAARTRDGPTGLTLRQAVLGSRLRCGGRSRNAGLWMSSASRIAISDTKSPMRVAPLSPVLEASMGEGRAYEQMAFALQNVAEELRRVLAITGFPRDPAITVSLRNADGALERAGLVEPLAPTPSANGAPDV